MNISKKERDTAAALLAGGETIHHSSLKPVLQAIATWQDPRLSDEAFAAAALAAGALLDDWEPRKAATPEALDLLGKIAGRPTRRTESGE